MTVIKQIFACAMLVGCLAFIGHAEAAPADALKGKTIVLVHGAFADGSSWTRVIPILEAKGLNVVAAQLPLSSLADDAAAVRRVIDLQTGPVVLVGHSWGGVVITQAGIDDKVKALVYVAAFAPDRGQSVSDLVKGLPAPAWSPDLVKDSGGFLRLSTDGIIHQFAQDLPASQARLVAATQGPWFGGCLDDKVTNAAWHDKPTWDVVSGNDHMIPTSLQDRMAMQIGAKVTKISSSHVVMLSHPDEVAGVILAAAAAVH